MSSTSFDPTKKTLRDFALESKNAESNYVCYVSAREGLFRCLRAFKAESRNMHQDKLTISELEERKKTLLKKVKNFVGDIPFEELRDTLYPKLLKELFEWLESEDVDYKIGESLARKNPNYINLHTNPFYITPFMYLLNAYQLMDIFKRFKLSEPLPENLKPLEFTEAKLHCFYNEQKEMEGYFVADYVNKVVFEEAKHFTTMSYDERLLLRKKVLEQEIIQTEYYKGKINEQYRYPIPEAKPWQGQEVFLTILGTLEWICTQSSSNITARELDLLSKTFSIPIEKLSKHIRLNFNNFNYRGFACQRLPVSRESSNDYSIIFYPKPDEEVVLSWTGALIYYVGEFNVLPSREFLCKLENFLKVCHLFRNNEEEQMIKLFSTYGVKTGASRESCSVTTASTPLESKTEFVSPVYGPASFNAAPVATAPAGATATATAPAAIAPVATALVSGALLSAASVSVAPADVASHVVGTKSSLSAITTDESAAPASALEFEASSQFAPLSSVFSGTDETKSVQKKPCESKKSLLKQYRLISEALRWYKKLKNESVIKMQNLDPYLCSPETITKFEIADNASECFQHHIFTEPELVYLLGMLLLSAILGKHPYQEEMDMEKNIGIPYVIPRIKDESNLEWLIPKDCPDGLIKVLNQTLAFKPENRMSLKELINTLSAEKIRVETALRTLHPERTSICKNTHGIFVFSEANYNPFQASFKSEEKREPFFAKTSTTKNLRRKTR